MTTLKASELIAQYSEYCTAFRVQKANSAVLEALKSLHHAQRADPKATLTELDLSMAYLGPRGILAVASLVTHIRGLQVLNLSNAMWYAGDEKSTAPSGENTVAIFCSLLTRHHGLNTLILGDCEFGPAQYLWLVEMIKKSPRLTRVDLSTPYLREHETFHLECLCKRNQKRMDMINAQQSVGDLQFDEHSAALFENDPSASASTERTLTALTSRRFREPTKAEHLVRSIVDSAASDVLLGNAEPTVRRLPQPGVAKKSEAELERIRNFFTLNPILSRTTPEVRTLLAHQMRQCFYKHDEIILEHLDPVDYVVLIVSGGAVSHRSDDIAMVHPTGSLLGDEEVFPPTVSETRRYNIRARPSLKHMAMADMVAMNGLRRKRLAKDFADGVDTGADNGDRCEAWFMPRDLFAQHIVKPALDHRARWRRLCDMVPALQVLGITAKLAVADAFEDLQFIPLEVIAAGNNMLNRMFVIVDGSAMVYYRHTEVKKLLRGEIFVCHNATDVAICSVVALEKTVVGCITEPRFQALPLHVQDHIASLGKVYSADDALGTPMFTRRSETS